MLFIFFFLFTAVLYHVGTDTICALLRFMRDQDWAMIQM